MQFATLMATESPIHNSYENADDHDSERTIAFGSPERTPERTKTGDDLSNEPERIPGGIKAENDVPPDGGYGWVCTACCFLINAHTWGVNSVS
jgi:hypothetical protein